MVNILAALQSPAAALTTPPVVTSEPPNQTVYSGDTVTLAAPAVDAMAMTWRWYAGTTLLSESTSSAALTLTHVSTAQAGTYHAEIANAYGSISSRSVALTVPPPLITLAPATAPNAGQQAMIGRKYGKFCHFGINTFQDQQWTDGTVSPSTYTPAAVDVEQWVRSAYLSGMTYILIIAKHHDGFCMWPSAQTTYDVAASPNTTDLMQLAAAACAKYGIKLAVYYSLWDRNWSKGAMSNDANSLTAAQAAAYVSYMKSQLSELLTQYGPVCELWLDGSWVDPASIWNLPEVYNHVKQIQSNCQLASNITIVHPPASQSAGEAIQYFPSDFRLNDPDLPKFPDPKTCSHGGDSYYLPFEATITLSSQNFWFFDTRETASKSLSTLDSSGNAPHFAINQNSPTPSPETAGGPLGRSGFTSTAGLLCGSGQINGFWNNNYALPADNSGMEIWVKAASGVTNGWILASGAADSSLSGTPALADVGANFFSIRATDAFGAAATLMLTITVAPPNPDANGNGMLDTWEKALFGNADAGANLPLADADGDGLNNFLEDALNTEPRQANASPVGCQLVPVSGQTYVRLTVPKNPQATNLTCEVEMSGNLTPGAWTAAPTVIENESATSLTLRVTQPVSATPHNYFRLRFVAAP